MPVICKKCGKDCTLYRANTPKAKEIWDAVERAASNCPEHIKKHVEKAVQKEKENFICKSCEPYQW